MKKLTLLLVIPLTIHWAGAKPVMHLNWDVPHEELKEVGIVYTASGPIAPEYPDFSKENKARRFDGSSRFEINDPGDGSDFDFENGDAITLEAWVAPNAVGDGDNVYIIGKGRTGNPKYPANNQNFALRLRGKNGMGCASFLFYSKPTQDHPGDWHRWTTNTGVIPQDGWGHVAIAYEFGKPESIKGYINGKETSGKWDMGGPTKLAPVVDNDQVWIGSSMGGSSRSSFSGSLDEVKVHREIVAPELLNKRYSRERIEKPVVEFLRKKWPADSVQVEVVEGVNIALGWPDDGKPIVARYEQDAFAFFRPPSKYSKNGVKEDHPRTFLIRAYTTFQLPKGTHELMLRYRWATKLWIDGELVQNLSQTRKNGSAHGSVPIIPEDWPEYLRIPSPGDAEVRFPVVSDGTPKKIRMEILVGDQHGKKKYRHDLGESLLAVSISGEKFHIVGHKNPFLLTDQNWSSWRRKAEIQLLNIDSSLRREASMEVKNYWENRHEIARGIVKESKPPELPIIPSFFPVKNEVDLFIGKRILTKAISSSEVVNESGELFIKSILPVLKEKCIKCHHGEKAKAGLHLDSLAGMLKGGDSDDPALVPGDVSKSLIFLLASSRDEDEQMPPKGELLNAGEIRALRQWIEQGAVWPEDNHVLMNQQDFSRITKEDLIKANIVPVELSDDLSFIRRVTMDITGVFPKPHEISKFVKDQSTDKRSQYIDHLLADPGWAHNWVGYWQDVLAENPNILKPRLNNTGPFRDWIFESFLDNKPMDQFVNELVMMEGSRLGGGPAGFSIATQNDVPMAAKAHVLSTAFMGTNLQCARCHDSPYQPFKQKDLFGIAAMLNRNSLPVPDSSRAKLPSIGDRKPLIEVTLKPGESVSPEWRFPFILDPDLADIPIQKNNDTRQRLADILTSPHNKRFAEVMVNRVWARYFGIGLVPSQDDWHNQQATHPELLDFLSEYFVQHNYDLKSLARLILNSHAYQRASRPQSPETVKHLYLSQIKRKLTAEQLVDSLYHATDLPMEIGELNMDRDGSSGPETFLNLGYPRRAWQLISLSNERDRPSLAFPRIQAVIDTLKQFGWRPSRQEPITEREDIVHALQPGILANGVLTTWMTRLSPDHSIAEASLQFDRVEDLVEYVFQAFLTRSPSASELQAFTLFLTPGFDDRVIPEEDRIPLPWPKKIPAVSWSNHLSPEANSIMIELEERARQGDLPTNALKPEWRERMEDVLWAMINSPELMFIP